MTSTHRYTALVYVNGRPEPISYYADKIVPDGHTLWFFREHKLVGALRDDDVHGLFRDDDRLIDIAPKVPQ